MYKDKRKQQEANRLSMQRLRAKQGITASGEGITQYPDIMYKLTDPRWRDTLGKLCQAFDDSHYPKYKRDVFLGWGTPDVIDLETACNYLGVTG